MRRVGENKPATRMVVDNVRNYGNAIEMANIYKGLELVHLTAEVINGERGAALLSKQVVRFA